MQLIISTVFVLIGGAVSVKQQCADYYAIPQECPSYCQPTCDDRRSPDSVNCIQQCLPSGCVCRPGYILNKTGGRCINEQYCPIGGQSCDGDLNATRVACGSACPKTCENLSDDRPCILLCITNACQCKPGYVLSNQGCINPRDCPTRQCKDPNAVPQDCASACQPTCNDRRPPSERVCTRNCLPGGCVCKPGFILDRTGGKCIPENQCPAQCNIRNQCKRTCASPNPQNCPYNPSETNNDGCNCMDGYILSDVNGKCIRIEECPNEIACNGDFNARATRCPAPCPATCQSPNERPCRRMCDPIGCECKDGYILSAINGKCILPDNCPYGNPCPINERFVSCNRVCPSEYCPTTDFRGIAICDGFPQRCRAGCICNINYKRRSIQDPRCIVSSHCPPVPCTTRINEVWGRCPTACLREDCINAFEPPTACNSLVLDCDPRCVCRQGHFRNGSDLCVPARQCPRPPIY